MGTAIADCRAVSYCKNAWRSKSEYLRDELREHTRLKKEGVLPADEFNEIMARILSHHEEEPSPS